MNRADEDQNDWTTQEEAGITFQLEKCLLGSESVDEREGYRDSGGKILNFPTPERRQWEQLSNGSKISRSHSIDELMCSNY